MPTVSRYTIPTQLLGLLAFLLITAVAAGAGAVASIEARTYYMQLTQPAWAPPASVFGPVWTALYLLMGIAAWLVWRVSDWRAVRGTLTLYVVQLVFNALWTWLFFAWHRGAMAFAEILLLWVLIVMTLVRFWRVRSAAAWMLAPYLLWVSFAAALNFAVWRLNPVSLG